MARKSNMLGRHQLGLLLEARRGPARIRASDPAAHGVRKNAASALIRRGLVERVKVFGIGARGQAWQFSAVRLTRAGMLALIKRDRWHWPQSISGAYGAAVVQT